MVVRLRLSIHGQRNNRIFHLVAINSKKRRDAKPIETLGVYQPHLKLGDKYKTLEWSTDRIKYWLGVGAQPSKSVVKLLEMGRVIDQNSKWHPKPLGPHKPELIQGSSGISPELLSEWQDKPGSKAPDVPL